MQFQMLDMTIIPSPPVRWIRRPASSYNSDTFRVSETESEQIEKVSPFYEVGSVGDHQAHAELAMRALGHILLSPHPPARTVAYD